MERLMGKRRRKGETLFRRATVVVREWQGFPGASRCVTSDDGARVSACYALPLSLSTRVSVYLLDVWSVNNDQIVQAIERQQEGRRSQANHEAGFREAGRRCRRRRRRRRRPSSSAAAASVAQQLLLLLFTCTISRVVCIPAPLLRRPANRRGLTVRRRQWHRRRFLVDLLHDR